MVHLPKGLDTRRSHRVIQFFIKRSETWSKENRDFSIYWSISHMTTTAQIMRLLAALRGIDPDICAIAGALHDVATMETGKAENHAIKALDLIDPLLAEYNADNEKLKINDEEIILLKKVISQHSNKDIYSENIYAETLKDADAIDRYLHGVETKETEITRLKIAFSALGIATEFLAE